MKKKILLILGILIITLCLTNCNKDKFNFKTKEEIVNSFTNYELELKVTSNGFTYKYLIKEDDTFVLFQANNGHTTLFDKTTKAKYLIKHLTKTKAMYLSTDDIEKQLHNIKETYFAAHVGLSPKYKKVEDEEVNGILCDVYKYETEETLQMCYVSKEDGFCVKTYSDVTDVVSYEILKYQKGNVSCREYFNYTSTTYSLWPDHELALMVPEVNDGTYGSHSSDEISLKIKYDNYNIENGESYVNELKAEGFTVNETYINQPDYMAFTAYNEEGYKVTVIVQGSSKQISIEIYNKLN